MRTAAAVCRAFGQSPEIVEIDVEPPHEGEVLVRLAASGVCHTDLTVLSGAVPFPLPIVLGHEGAGIVEAVGPDVLSVRPGDHVVLSWSPQCGDCWYCRKDQPYMCEVGRVARRKAGLPEGTPRFRLDGAPVHQLSGLGTFSPLLVAHETAVVPIDHDIPIDIAALIGCGVLTGVGAAINTADITPGDTVAVVGCGGVGLNVVQGAVLAGAERIIAVDRIVAKAELARRFGATDSVTAGAGATDTIRDLTAGRGADVVFEVVGLPATAEFSLEITRAGGQTCIVGMAPMSASMSVPMAATFTLGAKQLIGCNYGSCHVARDVTRMITAWRDGRLRLDDLVSRRIKLPDLSSALHAVESGDLVRTLIEYT